MQVKLESLADLIGKFGLFFAIITLLALIARLLLKIYADGRGWDKAKHPAEIVRAIIISVDLILIKITVVVVAIPEGLPLAVTLSLAYSVKEMLKEHNLVRKLNACETMGGADCICSDKTGTLTKNEMFVTHFFGSKIQKVLDMNTKTLVGVDKLITSSMGRKLLIDCIIGNSIEDLVG